MSAEELRRYLDATSAEGIPAGESGLWQVVKVRLGKPVIVPRDGKPVLLDAGVYTKLTRYTTAHPFETGIGEVVMEDTIYELQTHFQFMFQAFGDVLITGLGLGCVARGTLVNPRVRSVTVVERDADVLKLVAPHMPKEIQIIHAEALEFLKSSDRKFDCTWHDLWTDEDAGEPHLAVRHLECIHAAQDITTGFQGAWAFPRNFRKLMRQENVI